MYDYNYGYVDQSETLGLLGGLAAISGLIMIISLVIGIITLVSQWKIYKKAGKKGWECIVPIYNIVVLLQIVELPIWYIALFFVPIANIYAIFKIHIELAHKFGKSTGFGVATVFFSFICLPMLAFGKNVVYNGNNLQENNNIQPTQYNPSVALQNEINNGESSNTNPPFVFNQNINTAINHPEPTENINNNVNIDLNKNQEIQFNSVAPTPVINPQPEVNVIQTVPMEAQTVNNMQPSNPEPQVTPFVYNATPTTDTITSPINPTTQTVSVAPTPIVNPQPEVNMNQTVPMEAQTVNNMQPSNPEPQVNVIPGMGPTPQPTIPSPNPGNNSNNTTM